MLRARALVRWVARLRPAPAAANRGELARSGSRPGACVAARVVAPGGWLPFFGGASWRTLTRAPCSCGTMQRPGYSPARMHGKPFAIAPQGGASRRAWSFRCASLSIVCEPGMAAVAAIPLIRTRRQPWGWRLAAARPPPGVPRPGSPHRKCSRRVKPKPFGRLAPGLTRLLVGAPAPLLAA